MMSLLFSLWRVLSKVHNKKFLFLIVFLVFSAALEMLSILALFPAIKLLQDRTAMDENTFYQLIHDRLSFPPGEEFYILIFSIVLLIYFFKFVVIILINKYQFNFFAQIQSELSGRLFKKYLLSDYRLFFEVKSSELIRSVTEDAKNVLVLIVFSIATIVTEIFVAIPLFCFLVWINPLVSFFVLTIIIVCFYLINIFISRPLKIVGETIQSDSSRLIQTVNEGVGGIKELKILGNEALFIKAFDQQTSSCASGLARHLFLNSVPRLILELIFVLIFIVFLLALSFGDGLYESLSVLAIYAAAAFRLIPGLNRTAAAFNSLNMGRASLVTVVSELSGCKLPDVSPVDADIKPNIFEVMSVNSLSYSYPNGKSVLKDMSFEINAGEMIGVKGKSGSGKTTLIDILTGLVMPCKGSVLVNSKNIHSNIRQWQSLIGYVNQSFFLLDDSLRSNVAFGVPKNEVDDTKVWEALRKANLEAFVKELPNCLDTQMGERGIKFSGGQRQRIGIARALYRDPPVLIMDEATSSLDHLSEQEINKEVAKLKGGKTIIIISHKSNSFLFCDRILEIKDGQLVKKHHPIL